jgi:hypothetical protein
MKNWSIKIALVAILLMSLVLVLAVPAIAYGPQSWNLDSHEDHDGNVLPPSDLCQMEKFQGLPTDPHQSGEIKLTKNGGFQIWITDEAARGDVIFCQSDTLWQLELITDTLWDAANIETNCLVEIGEWDGADFNKFDSAIQAITYYQNTVYLTMLSQGEDEIVHKGCYLAIRVTNNESIDHIIKTGELEDSSCFTSNGGDPGYPNPPPPLPGSTWTGTGLMIGCFAVFITIFMIKGKHKRTA